MKQCVEQKATLKKCKHYMKESVVEQAVKTYFTDQIPQFSVSQQCEVQCGTRHDIADVVFHQLISDKRDRFVAIADCKPTPPQSYATGRACN